MPTNSSDTTSTRRRATAPPARGRTPAPTGADGWLERAGLWPLRVAWVLAPAGVGWGLADRLEPLSSAQGAVVEGALWLAWFVGLVATLVPTTVSLTAVRILAPASIGVVGLAASGADGGPTASWTAGRSGALAYAVLLTVVAFLAVTGDRMINGSAYGSERRMALRPPAFTLLGPIQVAWLAIFVGLVSGPLLVAAGQWEAGVVAAAIGAGACWLGGRALHQLARRWIVFVPAGFVIHDHVQAVESVLLRRGVVAALGPASTVTTARAGAAAAGPLAGPLDLSGGAWGLALEVATTESMMLGLRSNRQVVNTEFDRLVFTPTLPGAVLREARIRAIPIGTRA